MRVISTEATTPDGNKYKVTRLGRIVSTGALSAYGLVNSLKNMKSDEYVSNLAKCAKKAADNSLHSMPRARKTLFAAMSVAIAGLFGFMVGGIVDFCANRISKNSADKKAKNS